MRSPSMMAPLPVTSAGACLVQGRAGSGRSTVANTLTTLLLTSLDALSVGAGAAAGQYPVDAMAPETMRQRIQASFWFTCRPFRSITRLDSGRRQDRGVDLIYDPVGRQDGREQHAYEPQTPAPAPPRRPKRGILHRDIDDIRRAIADVRQNREHEQRQERRQRKGGAKMRPGEYQAAETHAGQHQV